MFERKRADLKSELASERAKQDHHQPCRRMLLMAHDRIDGLEGFKHKVQPRSQPASASPALSGAARFCLLFLWGGRRRRLSGVRDWGLEFTTLDDAEEMNEVMIEFTKMHAFLASHAK